MVSNWRNFTPGKWYWK